MVHQCCNTVTVLVAVQLFYNPSMWSDLWCVRCRGKGRRQAKYYGMAHIFIVFFSECFAWGRQTAAGQWLMSQGGRYRGGGTTAAHTSIHYTPTTPRVLKPTHIFITPRVLSQPHVSLIPGEKHLGILKKHFPTVFHTLHQGTKTLLHIAAMVKNTYIQ